MKVVVKKQVGTSDFTFEFEAAKAFDALFNAGFLAGIPEMCTLCQNKDVKLEGNKADGFTFLKVRCNNPNCRATAQVGTYKDGGYFWKQFEKYVPQGGQPSAPAAQPASQPSSPNEDIPF